MKRGFSLGSDGVVARSLKVTRTTHILVAALTGAVGANSVVAMEFLSFPGQIALLAMAFASVAIASVAVSADVFTRSSQAVANLRSIGASTGSLSWAVLGVVLTWGVVGAVLGGGFGAALGLGLAGTAGAGIALLSEVAEVAIASAAAMAAGVFVGASMAWRS